MFLSSVSECHTRKRTCRCYAVSRAKGLFVVLTFQAPSLAFVSVLFFYPFSSLLLHRSAHDHLIFFSYTYLVYSLLFHWESSQHSFYWTLRNLGYRFSTRRKGTLWTPFLLFHRQHYKSITSETTVSALLHIHSHCSILLIILVILGIEYQQGNHAYFYRFSINCFRLVYLSVSYIPFDWIVSIEYVGMRWVLEGWRGWWWKEHLPCMRCSQEGAGYRLLFLSASNSLLACTT